MNKMILIGRFVKDCEISESKKGVKYLKNTVACDKNSNTTYFYDIVSFGKNAEFIHEHFTKGSGVALCGNLEYEDYECDGVKRRNYTLMVTSVNFVPFNSEVRQPNE